MNIELNITLACNLHCANCNRLCHLLPDRTDHVSVAAVERVHQEALQAGGLGRVNVLGGEPSLHPQFEEILDIVDAGICDGAFRAARVDNNGATKFKPSKRYHRRMRFAGCKPGAKRHLPCLWSPADMGIETRGPCAMHYRCGPSLDNMGWLPCSMAIAIVRTFGYEYMYRDTLPTGHDWDWATLCKHCIFSMPSRWQTGNSRSLRDTTAGDLTPTPTWEAALARAGIDWRRAL